MKAITIMELKKHLRKYLRLASRGSRITVTKRNEPVAELGPPSTEALAWHDRMAREGRLRLGTQNWQALQISKLDRPIDIQASLRAVREDPSDSKRAGHRQDGEPQSPDH